MTDAEDRSDALDRQLMVVPQTVARDMRRVFVTLCMIALIFAAAFTVQFVVLLGIANEASEQSRRNYDAIVVQIPGLRKTIRDQQYVIDQQAVPSIVYLAEQLQTLGAQPPPLLLGPQHPTFAEQLEAAEGG